jgi:AcrR family transcriptional regulator
VATTTDGTVPDTSSPDTPGPDTSTRERILEIALDLFIEKGYDKTSLREIADRLGFTKAALYYHFASKGDILMALHLRMHHLLAEVLGETAGEPTTPELWARILDSAVDAALANRRLFLMHERNRAAFENLHSQDHAGEHDQIEVRFRELLADRTLPVPARVRLACSLGALMTGVMFGGEAFADVSVDEFGDALRGAVRDLLRGTGALSG